MSQRRCFDCGANASEAVFPGTRKPRGGYDRCTDCAADPGGVGFAERVAARIAEIARLRGEGRYQPQKPIHTTPLFAGLRAAWGGN